MLCVDDVAKRSWIIRVKEYLLCWIWFDFVFLILFYWIPCLVYVNARAENVNSAEASSEHVQEHVL